MDTGRDDAEPAWLPTIRKADGPVYLAIANALAADVQSGRLAPGTRLPSQRALADVLGIDFTTVSRAYSEASRRGLIAGRVGQGTFVRDARAPVETPGRERASRDGLVDMGMNMPPRFDDAGLVARLWDGVAGLGAREGLDLLLRYQEAGGAARDRLAGAHWLAPRLGPVPRDRILVCAGAQGALAAVLASLAAPGDIIAAEALTYPGFLALAAQLRLRLAAVAMDGGGLVPEAFDAICATHRPKALYCNPTLHNPTTATLSLARREALLAIARRHGVPVIEDDAYGALPVTPVPPLAALAPDLVYHVAGLAKCLSPALRIAYLVMPEGRTGARLTAAIRATAAMASPLTAALATRWIEDGTAGKVLAAIRAETRLRQAITAAVVPPDWMQTDPEGFHLWLSLPPPWTRGEVAVRLRSLGISVVASDAFAAQPSAALPEAIRLGLGAPAGQPELRRSLGQVVELLDQPPILSSMVV